MAWIDPNKKHKNPVFIADGDGFKVDEEEYQKFQDEIEQTLKDIATAYAISEEHIQKPEVRYK